MEFLIVFIGVHQRLRFNRSHARLGREGCRAERHHAWTVEQIRSLEAPLLTCEPVLAEAMYLLADLSRAQAALFHLLGKSALRIAFQVAENVDELPAL